MQVMDNNASGFRERVAEIQEKRNELSEQLSTADMDTIIQMIEKIDEQLQTLYNDLEDAVVIEGKKVTIMGARKVIVRKT